MLRAVAEVSEAIIGEEIDPLIVPIWVIGVGLERATVLIEFGRDLTSGVEDRGVLRHGEVELITVVGNGLLCESEVEGLMAGSLYGRGL